MRAWHVISAQANLRPAQVKPHRGGCSQNYMPPEAADAIKKGGAANASIQRLAPAASPVVK